MFGVECLLLYFFIMCLVGMLEEWFDEVICEVMCSGIFVVVDDDYCFWYVLLCEVVYDDLFFGECVCLYCLYVEVLEVYCVEFESGDVVVFVYYW